MKINRAADHLMSLNACMEAFLNKGPYRLLLVEGEVPRQRTIRYETDPLPDDVSLIIGDCIHNMRASLDHVATEVLRRHNGNTKLLYFPFDTTRDGVTQKDSFKGLMTVAPQLHDAILDQVRPIRDDNYQLSAMNKADNIDKHNLLIAILAIIRVTGVRAVDENDNWIWDVPVEFGAGTTFNFAHFYMPAKIISKGKATFRFNFARGTYFDGRSIFPALANLIEMIQKAIVDLEAAYFGLPKRRDGEGSVVHRCPHTLNRDDD